MAAGRRLALFDVGGNHVCRLGHAGALARTGDRRRRLSGATGKALLQTQFASVGTYIVTVSMILGGLLLSTDYALVRLLIWALTKPSRGLGRGVLQVGTAYAQKLGKRRSGPRRF